MLVYIGFIRVFWEVENWDVEVLGIRFLGGKLWKGDGVVLFDLCVRGRKWNLYLE